MIRLFVEPHLAAGAMVAASPEQAHYLGRVMRQPAGASVLLFNGRDGEWRATIVEIARGGALLRADEARRPWAPPPDLDLLVAVVKRGRLETIVEKAAELGAARIRPVFTARTNEGRVNLGRLRAIAVEAAEQTGRLDVPRIVEPVSLASLMDGWSGARRLMFCDEAAAAPSVLEGLGDAERGAPWSILVGPEGGFTAQERAAARASAGVVPVSLGPRILRADTAAIAAMTLWQSALGDWAAS